MLIFWVRKRTHKLFFVRLTSRLSRGQLGPSPEQKVYVYVPFFFLALTCSPDLNGTELLRPDPCSVDFGRETPKFRFAFWWGFFPPRKKGPKKSTKNLLQNSPRKCVPINFCRISAEAFLMNCRFWIDNRVTQIGRFQGSCEVVLNIESPENLLRLFLQ